MLRRAVDSLKVGSDGERHDENQYLALISDILEHGEEVVGEMEQPRQFLVQR